MPLVINGKKVSIPGVSSGCYLDNKKLSFTNTKDYRPRKTDWVRNICIHTRMGIWPQSFGPTDSDNHWDTIGVVNASNDTRSASWHISIDSDGSFVCHLDLLKHAAYHCGQVNEYSVGIEMYQTSTGFISNETLATCVKVVDAITRELGIQRQFCKETTITRRMASGDKPSDTATASTKLSYLPAGESGKNFVGVFGHRNATRNRGKGDPGDRIFDELAKVGYEGYYIDAGEDLAAWKIRQERLMLPKQSGIPDQATVAIIKADKQAHGVWIPRPGDDGIPYK